MTAPALSTFSSGVSQVSGDNLNTFGQTCNIVSDLRGFIGAAGIQVYLRGFTAINDGGQGQFYWNVSGTGPDDSGITNIVPGGSTTGCWTRIAGVFPGTLTAYSFIPTSSTAPSNGMYLYAANIVGISANSTPVAIFAGATNAVNFLEIVNRVTGSDPYIQAVGGDTNVGILLATKGTGGLGFYTNTVSLQFGVAHTASAANYIQATGNPAGGGPNLSSVGSDSTITFNIFTKTSSFQVFSGVGLKQFEVAHTASAANYISMSGGVTGSPAITTITAAGTSTDIDINIIPKGAGQARLPTTANGSTATAMSSVGPTGSRTTVQEWFTVKNASGTLRYIPAF